MDTFTKNDSLMGMGESQQLILLDAILQNPDYSIIAVDLQGAIIAWNKGAEMRFGYSVDEINNISRLYHPKDIESGKIKRILQAVKETGRWNDELTFVGKNNVTFTSPINIALFYDAQANPKGFTLISRCPVESQLTVELTENQNVLQTKNKELEATNDKILEATKLKNIFIANLSHDLRSPLNGIIGFSEVIRAEKSGPILDIYKDYLDDILYSARHLLALINDMLDLAKIEAGKMEFHPEKIDLNTLILGLKTIFKKIILDKNIAVNIRIDPCLEIIIDELHFKRVICNLVSNALKFTPQGGSINISVISDKDGYFRLQVEDTGIGISAGDLDRLFIPFQQLDNSSQTKYHGTVLGLSLSQDIIDAQGGYIGVESKLGKGTTFTVILPCINEAITNIATVPPIDVPSDAPPSILIIGSLSKESNKLSNNLSKTGYSVKTVATIAEAIELQEITEYNVVVLDLLLTDLDKWKLLRAFRTKSTYKKAPTLLISGTERFGFKIHDFMLKPINHQEFIQALKWAGANPWENKTVLVVDDDAKDLKSSKKVLKEFGYKSFAKSDLQEALIILEQKEPDALILNLFMETKDINGFDFLRAVRLTSKGRYTPVVITTLKSLNDEDKEHLQHIIQRLILKKEKAGKSLLTEIMEQFPIEKNLSKPADQNVLEAVNEED